MPNTKKQKKPPVKPAHQHLFEIIAFILVGLAAAGSLFDTISNSISLITPRLAICLTALIIVIWLVIEVVTRKIHIPLLDEKNVTQRFNFSLQHRCCLVGILIALWLPVLVKPLLGHDGPGDGKDKITKLPTNIDLTEPKITFSYMRLFGAFQVPAFFVPQGSVPTNIEDGTFFAGLFDFTNTNKWWTSNFPNTALLREPVWSQTQSAIDDFNDHRQEISKTVLWRLTFRDSLDLATKKLQRLQWLENTMEAAREDPEKFSFAQVKQLDKEDNQIHAYMKKYFNDIGFLFLVLDWQPKDTEVENVKLYFRKVDRKFGDAIDSSTLIDEMKTTDLESLIIPVPQSPSKQLWLLGVYQKDADGYPKTYLSTVVDPLFLTWERNGQTERREIRKPLGAAAAKVDIPFGWFAQ